MQEKQPLITKNAPCNFFDDLCCDSIIPAKGSDIPTESVFSMPIILKIMAKRLSKICSYMIRCIPIIISRRVSPPIAVAKPMNIAP